MADSMAVGHLIAWGITHNWQQELCRLILAVHGGHERAERILPPLPWPGAPSLAAEGGPRQLPPSVAPELEPLFPARPWSGSEAREHVRASVPSVARRRLSRSTAFPRRSAVRCAACATRTGRGAYGSCARP